MFWRVVEDCLIQIYRRDGHEAAERTAELRERIEHPPTGMSTDIFYHTEPFDVASDIAEELVDLCDYQATYDEILNRRGR